jgi:hypothetical protein
MVNLNGTEIPKIVVEGVSPYVSKGHPSECPAYFVCLAKESLSRSPLRVSTTEGTFQACELVWSGCCTIHANLATITAL